jgi:hypothetical protein
MRLYMVLVYHILSTILPPLCGFTWWRFTTSFLPYCHRYAALHGAGLPHPFYHTVTAMRLYVVQVYHILSTILPPLCGFTWCWFTTSFLPYCHRYAALHGAGLRSGEPHPFYSIAIANQPCNGDIMVAKSLWNIPINKKPCSGDIMVAKSLWNIPINKKPHSGDIMVAKERPPPLCT